MRGKVIRTGEVHAIGSEGWEIHMTAEKEGIMQSRPWSQLDIEILPRLFGPSRERRFIVREDDQAVTIAGDRRKKVKRAIAMSLR